MENGIPIDYEALPLRLAYTFLAANGLGEAAEGVRTSKDQFRSYTTTLKRAKIVALLNSKGLLDAFVEQHWPLGAIEDRREIRKLMRIHERWMETEGDSAGNGEHEEEGSGGEFALEEHLRDYLAANLHILENGMGLWPLGDDRDAVEFVVDDDGRRIDILAKDSHGVPTVIELKVSRGHERVIGQSLYYRACIKKRFNVPKVRIAIVAAEISPELRAATADLPDVSLYEYRLSMSVREV